MRIKHLQVYVDSVLITNHFNGSYAVKGRKMIKYLEIMKKMATDFKLFSIEQVPMEDNVEADALANLGSSFKIPPEISIPILHVLTPAIE
jgi:ribonuclease HI